MGFFNKLIGNLNVCSKYNKNYFLADQNVMIICSRGFEVQRKYEGAFQSAS